VRSREDIKRYWLTSDVHTLLAELERVEQARAGYLRDFLAASERVAEREAALAQERDHAERLEATLRQIAYGSPNQDDKDVAYMALQRAAESAAQPASEQP
jgi:hypothetical protein